MESFAYFHVMVLALGSSTHKSQCYCCSALQPNIPWLILSPQQYEPWCLKTHEWRVFPSRHVQILFHSKLMKSVPCHVMMALKAASETLQTFILWSMCSRKFKKWWPLASPYPCAYVTSLEELDWYSWNVIFGSFTKICWQVSVMDSFREDIYVFLLASWLQFTDCIMCHVDAWREPCNTITNVYFC
jgi:hypothetical protein